MKKIILFLLFFISFHSFSQKYISRNGSVMFNASTPIESINSTNNYVSCALDLENGNLVFQMNVISFKFERSLMEQHFNEKYLESDKFPKSTFVGSIIGFENDSIGNGIVEVLGVITIHGVSKEILVEGNVNKVGGIISLSSQFILKTTDFNIKIPRIVRDKISENVQVSINIDLKEQ